MKLFPSEPEIDEETGFTDENDIFQRREFAKGITNLLAASQDPLVIALDSGWGTGKTVFLKSWAGELRKDGFPVVMFDAFKHDYMDDAFAAIAGAIITLAEDKAPGSETVEKFKTGAISVLKLLTRSGLKLGVKFATAGALDFDELKDAAKPIGDETASIFDKHIGELITKQKEQQSLMQQFRETLATLPELLAADKENQKPLIFIIDELDRCRPTFALEILEKIKHFFSVANVHFILGVHMGQLQNSVKAQYGLVDDPRTYLEKFISVTLRFDDYEDTPTKRSARRYVYFLCKEMGINQKDEEMAGLIKELLPDWTTSQSLNLRTIQKIIAQVVIITELFGTKIIQKDLVIALCYLKVAYLDLYKGILSEKFSYTDVSDALGLNRTNNKVIRRELYECYFNKDAPKELIESFGGLRMMVGDLLYLPARLARKYVEALS